MRRAYTDDLDQELDALGTAILALGQQAVDLPAQREGLVARIADLTLQAAHVRFAREERLRAVFYRGGRR